ncbi:MULTISPECIES: hypothetical protein [Bacillus]|uniref:hypothetical protein n=1 Tax=Bacillus TaxID=1386 RepID=UPI000BA8759C|nr:MULTISPECIES: hypothetical protein [Bacillus]MBU2661808.1 hypothetical protein [Bacillus cabrialesii]PAO69916.1 hypothetical protein CIK44_04145 [Bacillus sp. X2(2017)]
MSNKNKDLKSKIKRNSSAPKTFFDQYQFEENNNNINNNDDKNNTNPSNIIQNDNVINNNIDNNIDNDIDNIINNNRINDHVQIGIYFEPAVADALKPLSRKKIQSKFVNAAVKKVLKEKGMLN